MYKIDKLRGKDFMQWCRSYCSKLSYLMPLHFIVSSSKDWVSISKAFPHVDYLVYNKKKYF